MKYSNQLVSNSVPACKYGHDTMPFKWTGKRFYKKNISAIIIGIGDKW
jgi:hypothetical protein